MRVLIRTHTLVAALVVMSCGPLLAQTATVPRPASNGAVTPGPALAPATAAPAGSAPVTQITPAPSVPLTTAPVRTTPTPTAPVSDPQRARETMNSGRNAFGCPDLDPLCQQGR